MVIGEKPHWLAQQIWDGATNKQKRQACDISNERTKQRFLEQMFDTFRNGEENRKIRLIQNSLTGRLKQRQFREQTAATSLIQPPLKVPSRLEKIEVEGFLPPHPETLREMPYKEFLKSDYWAYCRKAIYARDRYACRICGIRKRPGIFLQVHHLSYEHHGEEFDYPDDLITICDRCHRKEHNLPTRLVIDSNSQG